MRCSNKTHQEFAITFKMEDKHWIILISLQAAPIGFPDIKQDHCKHANGKKKEV